MCADLCISCSSYFIILSLVSTGAPTASIRRQTRSSSGKEIMARCKPWVTQEEPKMLGSGQVNPTSIARGTIVSKIEGPLELQASQSDPILRQIWQKLPVVSWGSTSCKFAINRRTWEEGIHIIPKIEYHHYHYHHCHYYRYHIFFSIIVFISTLLIISIISIITLIIISVPQLSVLYQLRSSAWREPGSSRNTGESNRLGPQESNNQNKSRLREKLQQFYRKCLGWVLESIHAVFPPRAEIQIFEISCHSWIFRSWIYGPQIKLKLRYFAESCFLL